MRNTTIRDDTNFLRIIDLQKRFNLLFCHPDDIRNKVLAELRGHFRPEFLNRVDEVICFNQLSEENFRAIARIMLKELQDVLKEKDLDFTWDEAVLDQLVKDSYSAAYGARNLRRHIQKALEDPIATKIIDSYLSPIHALKAVVEDGKILITAL